MHVAYARLQATAYRARLTQGRYIWSYLYDKYVCMFVSLSHCLSLIAYVPYTRPWAAPLSGAVQSNVYSRRINKQIRCPCACRRTMYVKQLPWECVSRLSQLFFIARHHMRDIDMACRPSVRPSVSRTLVLCRSDCTHHEKFSAIQYGGTSF